MAALHVEQFARARAKGDAFLRGALARYRFARRAVHQYVNRKVVDPATGKKKRVYVNLRTGAVLTKRPYFLKAFGMEPAKEEAVLACLLVQRAVRRRRAWREAKGWAMELYEEQRDPADGQPYWFNPKTGASSWVKPRWLD